MTGVIVSTTFHDSLAKLQKSEKLAAMDAVFKLMADPANPGLNFERLKAAKDKRFRSIRASQDIRIILHQKDPTIVVLYVDHHDKAYTWAENRKLEIHPTTRVPQIVEIREKVVEIEIPTYVEKVVEAPNPAQVPETQIPFFADIEENDLLKYGVPPEWIPDVRTATDSNLLDLCDRLPEEAAEALLQLATGEIPETAPAIKGEVGFDHPDAKRRFHLFTDEEELALALEFPWEKWTIFLHPSQRKFVDQVYSGPARVAGSAGTGKTVVALHRAVTLAKRNTGAQVLLTTFTRALADLLQIKLHRLAGESGEVSGRINVRALPDIAADLFSNEHGKFVHADAGEVRKLIGEVIEEVGSDLKPVFVWSEWRFVIDAWQVDSLEAYQNVPRIGRKTRLGAKQREKVWEVASRVRKRLQDSGRTTWDNAYTSVMDALKVSGERPYDCIIVDEAQDLSVSQLRMLAVMGDSSEEALFFAGDGGQRIFQQAFSWKALGVDVRGRSNRLRVNYRTSHQIRSKADILLPDEVSDVDGNIEERKGTVSVFNGTPPVMVTYTDQNAEIEGTAKVVLEMLDNDFAPEEIGLFVRSEAQMPRARAALKAAGVEWAELERTSLASAGKVAVATMHLAKGLEFRGVIAMACDDDVIPLEQRIHQAADESELEDVFETERHLLYVAATRAREHLIISGIDPVSEFVDDMA